MRRAFTDPWLGVTLVAAIAIRAYAYLGLGVRLDVTTLPVCLQFIDPELLKTRLWESLWYLREQPPLFNLLLGVSMQAAPVYYADVLQVIFVLLGVALSTGLYLLMRDLRVPAPVAAFVAIAYAAHPTTLLYENWLIYEYPVTVLLTLASLLLYRYLAHQRPMTGILFFAVLALIVLTRGTFHLLWLLLIVTAVALLPGMRLRSVAHCAAIPLALAAALYVKNAFVFGDLLAGDVYRKLNYAVMRFREASPDAVAGLLQSGAISRVAYLNFYLTSVSDYQPYLPPLRDTGIPLLDRPKKSTGRVNWHHHAMPQIAELYYRDARVIDAACPGAYRQAVRKNLERFFLPSSDTMPFDVPDYANTVAVRSWLQPINRFLALQRREQSVAWFIVLLLPIAVFYGLYHAVLTTRSAVRRFLSPDRAAQLGNDERQRLARSATLAFAAFNVLYVATTTILLSYADHNRYRFCVTPLFVALSAAMLTDAVRQLRAHRAGPTVVAGVSRRSDGSDSGQPRPAGADRPPRQVAGKRKRR